MGGFGGTAADRGDVRVVNDGLIVTEGFLSRGIFAHSIGGGGGNGGATDYDIAPGTDGAPYSYRSDFSDLMEVKGDNDAATEFSTSLQQPALGDWGRGQRRGGRGRSREMSDGSGFSVRAGYQGQSSEEAESHWVGIRVAKAFCSLGCLRLAADDRSQQARIWLAGDGPVVWIT